MAEVTLATSPTVKERLRRVVPGWLWASLKAAFAPDWATFGDDDDPSAVWNLGMHGAAVSPAARWAEIILLPA